MKQNSTNSYVTLLHMLQQGRGVGMGASLSIPTWQAPWGRTTVPWWIWMIAESGAEWAIAFLERSLLSEGNNTFIFPPYGFNTLLYSVHYSNVYCNLN